MARPKKVILLYSVCELQRSVLTLMFEIWGYRVIGGISKLPPAPDVVVVVDDRSLGTAEIAKSIDGKHPNARMLVIPARGYKRLPQGYPRNMEPLPARWRPDYLRERLKLVTRKRAPNQASVERLNPQNGESVLIAGSSGPA